MGINGLRQNPRLLPKGKAPTAAAIQAGGQALALGRRIEAASERPLSMLDEINQGLAEKPNGLLDYAEVLWPVIEPGRVMKRGWALEAMAEHLEAVHSGEITKLLINVPPGMMKSLLTNVCFPTWEWGPRNRPDLRYISASYAQELTIRDNRRGRQLMQSDLYQRRWGKRFKMSMDQDAKVRYDNDHRGFRIATSVGGLSTGERGDRFIIDDPHNVKTAESEARLDEVAQWLTEVVPTRVNDLNLSAFIVIMQRVHERDASGVILGAGLGYVHLNLPMEFESGRRCGTVVKSVINTGDEHNRQPFFDPRKEEGELLFPERFDAKGVTQLKKVLSSWGGDYAVAGQLQQRPAPRGGGMFKTEGWRDPEHTGFRLVEGVPPGGKRVRGWDIAGSTRKTSPFTASVKLTEVKGTYYVEHVTRERLEIELAEAHIKATVTDDGPQVLESLPQDPGSAGKSQKAHMGKALNGFNFKITPESGDKADRAMPIAAQWNNGNVKVVKGDWNNDFIGELSTFPRGHYKDQADALSRAYSEHVMGSREEGFGVGVVVAADNAPDAYVESLKEGGTGFTDQLFSPGAGNW